MLRRFYVCVAVSMVAIGVVAAPVSAAQPSPVPSGTKGALAWGRNVEGQLGDGTKLSHVTPVEPFGLHSGVRQISAGEFHTVAVLDGGGVVAWGFNVFGQLGDGTHDTHLIPLPVNGLGPIVQVSAGGVHTLALARDGTVWAWGANSHGQLGDGTLGERLTPVRVIGLDNIIQVSAGGTFSLALRSDGTVWAWGENSGGQIGNGTLEDVARPFAVSGLPTIVEVSAGGSHSLALQSDGRVWAWGSNQTGQIGDGTLIDRLTPVQMPLLTHATHVSAGISFSVILIAGQPLQWGEVLICNQGDGRTEIDEDIEDNRGTCSIRSPRFTAIELRGVEQISAGLDGVAIRSDGTVWQWSGVVNGPTPQVSQVEVGGAVQVDAGHLHKAVLVDRPPVLQP